MSDYDAYKTLVMFAARDIEFGDDRFANLIVAMLIEADQAKHLLRKKGYGVTGAGLLDTCREVPNRNTPQ